MKTLIKDIYKDSEEYFEKEIQVEGWVRNLRALKNLDL